MTLLLTLRSSATAAWSFRQENSGDTGTGTPSSYSVTLGVATTGGAVLIICVSDATVATPSGFVLDASQVNNNGHYVFRKASSTGETGWTLTPGASAAGTWYVAEIAGLTGGPDRTSTAGSGTSSPTPRSTGTTLATTVADELALASWGSSSVVNPAVSASAQTNGFVERIADRLTTKASGTNVGLSVASKTLTATGTVETTATPSGSAAWTAVLVTYPVATGSSATGSATGTGTASGTVTGLRSDSGTVTGTATATGTVTGARSDAGSVTGTATASASSVGNAGAAGGSTALATAAGIVTGQRTDTGAVTGTATAQGNVVPTSLLGDVRIRRAVVGRF